MNLNKIKELYDKNIDEFGIDPRSVGWGTQDKINIRFRQLFKMIDNPAEPFTLNELGCGYGEAVRFCANNGLALKEFYGYDISDKMLEAAKEYLKEYKNIHLQNQPSLSKVCDYSLTSGIFNVKFDTGEKEWNDYILSVLHNLNDNSGRGFAFNMLTSYVDFKNDGLNYADPLYYFDYCKRNFSRHVSLLHDYKLYEFTIVVKKDEVQ